MRLTPQANLPKLFAELLLQRLNHFNGRWVSTAFKGEKVRCIITDVDGIEKPGKEGVALDVEGIYFCPSFHYFFGYVHPLPDAGIVFGVSQQDWGKEVPFGMSIRTDLVVVHL